MGVFDKLINLFTEDVEDDEVVNLEEEKSRVYEEPADALPKVMRDNLKKEKETEKYDPMPEMPKEVNKDVNSEVRKKFNFPIDIDDEVPSFRSDLKRENRDIQEFNKTKEYRESLVSREKPINNDQVINKRSSVREEVKEEIVKRENPKKEINETLKKNMDLYPKKVEKTKFKPTPVISPVYGVLDKNYTKEEVREKAEDSNKMKRPSKTVDFETVRKKAFGNLTDELNDSILCENCELYREAKKTLNLSSDDLLYDMTVEDEKTTSETSLEKAIQNYEDYGVEYEPVNKVKEEVLEYNKDDDDSEIVKFDEEIKIGSRFDNKKEKDDNNKKVDDDFFQLIDSMYKERIDE